jgi:hypothetical protein
MKKSMPAFYMGVIKFFGVASLELYFYDRFSIGFIRYKPFMSEGP